MINIQEICFVYISSNCLAVLVSHIAICWITNNKLVAWIKTGWEDNLTISVSISMINIQEICLVYIYSNCLAVLLSHIATGWITNNYLVAWIKTGWEDNLTISVSISMINIQEICLVYISSNCLAVLLSHIAICWIKITI